MVYRAFDTQTKIGNSVKPISVDSYSDLAFAASTFHLVLQQLTDEFGDQIAATHHRSESCLGQVHLRAGPYSAWINLSWSGPQTNSHHTHIAISRVDGKTEGDLQIFPYPFHTNVSWTRTAEVPENASLGVLRDEIKMNGLPAFIDWMKQQAS